MFLSASRWRAALSGFCQNDAKGQTHRNAAYSRQMVSKSHICKNTRLRNPILTFLSLSLSLTYMCRAGAIRTDDSCIVLKVKNYIHLMKIQCLNSCIHVLDDSLCVHTDRLCRVWCGCAVKIGYSRSGWRGRRRWPT